MPRNELVTHFVIKPDDAAALLTELTRLQAGLRMAIKGILRDARNHEEMGNRYVAAYAGATARHLDNLVEGVTRVECDDEYCMCPDGHPRDGRP